MQIFNRRFAFTKVMAQAAYQGKASCYFRERGGTLATDDPFFIE
jgi:hypothetical protein